MTNHNQMITLSNAMTLTYTQNPGQLGLSMQIHIGTQLSDAQRHACTLHMAQNYVVEAYFKTRAHDLGITLETVSSPYLTTYEINEGLDEAAFIGVLKQLEALFTFIDYNTLRDVKARVLDSFKQAQKDNNNQFGAVFLDDAFAIGARHINFMQQAIQKLTLQNIQDFISETYVPAQIHIEVSGPKELGTFGSRVQYFKI